ncbi:MAG TPA: MHYT domain-containing protein, partial [Ramlibacter sp.]|nr:MHYT domain-containing protein [Ramlibacter sp.]
MLQGRYEPPLVVISILVAVLASYTALALAGRVRHAKRGGAVPWIIGGGFAMGTGIWAMHFVGMLAFRMPIPLGYDLELTFVSWLLAAVISSAALWQAGLPNLRAKHLAVSALLMGVGIAAMHYLGMAAMLMEPGIQWNPALVVLSILIAISAASVALWIASRLRDRTAGALRARALAAVVMGLAIVGMHYTGMAAAGFPEGSVCGAANASFTLSGLASLVTFGTAAVLAIALITALYDSTLEARNEILTMSQRVAHERELLLQREQSARAEVERLSDLKDQFLATLSHELRTPLHAILGWVQLLRVKKDDAALEKGLLTIERNAKLQAQLIDDLLDMSRIVAGKVRLEPTWVDVAQLTSAVVEAFGPAAYQKGIRLTATEPGTRISVWGDPGRLQQVISNLLGNAIKFTPEHGEVSVELEQGNGQVVLRIKDTGAGIDRDFLPHVFERFRQADGGTTRRHGGLGLGLAIVRQLLELHAGSVRADSDGQGHGSTFTVTLPSGPSDPKASVQAASDLADAGRSALIDLHGCEVLVVDDEHDARALAEEILRECGAGARGAGSAAEALAQLQERAPDVIVCDIGMPDVDGLELLRRIRQGAAATAHVPAIALTAFTRAQDRQR